MLVNAGLSNKFWAENIDIANYFKNCLVLEKHNKKIILKERWTNKKQDVSHLKIFGSTLLTHISKEKRQKSDIKKTWKGIFVGYTNTTKHYRVYVLRSQQIFIASESYMNKSRKRSNLLLKDFLLALLRQLIREPKQRDLLRLIFSKKILKLSNNNTLVNNSIK